MPSIAPAVASIIDRSGIVAACTGSALLVLVSCGGGHADIATRDAAATAPSSTAQTIVLDLDRLESDAAAARLAHHVQDHRGADEPVTFLVRAPDFGEALALAARLHGEGIDRVVVDAD